MSLEPKSKGTVDCKLRRYRKPLCDFLEKPVPTTTFPNGNTPKAYEARMAQGYMAVIAQAKQRLNLLVVAIVVTTAVTAALSRRP